MKIATIVLTSICSLIIIPMIAKMLTRQGYVRENFRKEKIPNSMGLIYMITILSLYLLLAYNKDMQVMSIGFYLPGIIVMGLIGFLDDSIGNTEVKGFKGHIRLLFKGQLTTGGLKALTGGTIALIISLFVSYSVADIIINTIIIALFTNFQNLLDLRPGRASKVFIFLLLATYYFEIESFKILSIAFLITTIIYFPLDIKAKAMLGDTGANIQGVLLGILFVRFSLVVRLVVMVLLIGVNLYSEKKSITVLIKNNRVLNYIDMLGRDN